MTKVTNMKRSIEKQKLDKQQEIECTQTINNKDFGIKNT